MELHIRYRPTTIDGIVGQPAAVSVMKKWGDSPPHVVMLHGPVGTGKTTAALALMNGLGATKKNGNLYEINAADDTGVDNVRRTLDRMGYRGLGKKVAGKDPIRAWVWDEVHLLSGQAMSALLSDTEKMPPHAYFVFTTSHPHKVLPSLRSRCTQVEMKAVPDAALKQLAASVAKAEKPRVPVSDKVIAELVARAGGCARHVLVELGKVLPLATDAERIAAIVDIQTEQQAIDLCRLLMKRPAWADVAKMIKAIKAGGSDHENVRRVCLGYADAILTSGKRDKMAESIGEMARDNWYDCGWFGLTAMCLSLSK